jgi:endoglycosylceramidase
MYNERYQGEGWPDWAALDDGLPAVPQVGFPENYFLMAALQRAYDSFWANREGPDGRGLQEAYAQAWAYVARRFRGLAGVAGFDLINEPFPGSDWRPCFYAAGCPDQDAKELTPFYRRVIGAIRAVDHRTPPFYTPWIAFNGGPKTHLGGLGRNVAMAFHIYCVHGTPGANLVYPDLESQPCPRTENLVWRNAAERRRRTGDAILLTEFGSDYRLPGSIERAVRQADRNGAGWIEWTYWNTDPSEPTPNKGIVKDPARPPRGDNVRWERVALLDRPHPQRIAGSNPDWHYSPERRVFRLRYRPRGRAPTIIWTAPARYPDGRKITVRGADVSRGAKRGVVLVEREPGAKRVGITIRPKGAG